jgi:hypothetical protein
MKAALREAEAGLAGQLSDGMKSSRKKLWIAHAQEHCVLRVERQV